MIRPRALAGHRAGVIRGALAEGIGTAFLVTAVVGSGIAASRLSPTDTGLQLLENSIATAAALAAIILALGPVSGAQLNPVITLIDLALGGVSGRTAAVYIAAQISGGAIGAAVANAMFSLPLAFATRPRAGGDLWLGEIVATFGLVLVVFGVVRGGRSGAAPYAVAAYIGGAYFFTSSTSFANPAVTLARALSDSFAGIAPGSVPGFIAAQLAGGALGLLLVRLLYPHITSAAQAAVAPHPS